MKVFVIGQGGREHAIAWKLIQSEKVEKVFVCPGNGGTAKEKNIENIDISITDIPALINFAIEKILTSRLLVLKHHLLKVLLTSSVNIISKYLAHQKNMLYWRDLKCSQKSS